MSNTLLIMKQIITISKQLFEAIKKTVNFIIFEFKIYFQI